MKGTIIGTDLLEQNDSVKILEINTNATIYNEGADTLDYDVLFDVLVDNNITEFHFIYTEGDTHVPLAESYRFEDIIKERCESLGIEYFKYAVPNNSITVPYIEDRPSRFILRQSYDTTALVDETYCADKFEFFNLMSGSSYIPNTYISSSGINLNTLSSIPFIDGNTPNILVKHRYPIYAQEELPALYSVTTEEELTQLKSDISETDNNLVQEFVYDETNILDGRWNVIRSVDIIYGSELDTIHMGGYKNSSIVPLDFFENEFVSGSKKLNIKTKFKYINKPVGRESIIDYHTDDDSMILDYTGSLKDVDTLQLGDYIKSINFVDFNGNNASNFEEGKLDILAWDSTVQQTSASLTDVSSSLNAITSASVETIYIRITLENGTSWTDAPSCTYYFEESGSLSTRWDKVNKMMVGDKLVLIDPTTNELSTELVTGLEMEYTHKTIYALDFEPSDLFLVDIGDGLFGIMHNSCWCPWIYCGYYCNSSYCPGCGGGGFRIGKR
jgi:hypothetical protein